MVSRSVEEIRRIKALVGTDEARDVFKLIDAAGFVIHEGFDVAWLAALAYRLGKADAVAEARAKRRAVAV